MTPEAFRELALDLPEAVEASHMGHPDFRVGGKIFATLVRLKKARVATIRRALAQAWRNTAPKKLVRRFDGKE